MAMIPLVGVCFHEWEFVLRRCRWSVSTQKDSRGSSDVFLAYDHRLYLPFGGVDFGNLEIAQKQSRPWFGWDREHLPVQPSTVDVKGTIKIVAPDGPDKIVHLDDETGKTLFL